MSTIKLELDTIQQARSNLAEALISKFGVRELDNSASNPTQLGLWTTKTNGTKDTLKRLIDWAALVNATNVHTDGKLIFSKTSNDITVNATEFNGITDVTISANTIGALPLSGGSMSAGENTGTIKKNNGLFIDYLHNTASTTPIIRIASSNLDTTILRVWSTDLSYADTGRHGFSLKYLGSKSGNQNALVLYSDNSTATDLVSAISIKQNGYINLGNTLEVVNAIKTNNRFISTVATGTPPLLVDSTTQVNNLNVDLLDGYHANGLFTDLSNNTSTNEISVTIGGKNKSLTVAYSDKARYITCPDTRNTSIIPSEVSIGVQFDFKASSATSLIVTPFSGVMTYRVCGSGEDLSGGPVHLVAYNNAGIYWRKSADTSTWESWQKIITSGNITNYYWANIKISNEPKLDTSPQFSSVKASNAYFFKHDDYLYSDNYVRNIVAKVDSAIPLVIEKTNIRRGISLEDTTLGTSNARWKTVYGVTADYSGDGIFGGKVKINKCELEYDDTTKCLKFNFI